MTNDRPIPAVTTHAEEGAKAILKARARALARPAADRRAADGTLEVIEFRLARERYAIELKYLREAHPLHDLSPVPCVPAFVLGIINLRGRIFPVIDIKKFFDLPEAGIVDIHVVLIVEYAGVELGILGDTITGVRSIAPETMQSSLPTLTGIRGKYLKGVTDGNLAVLDIPNILSDPKLLVNEEVAG